jgi:hypothetical protein
MGLCSHLHLESEARQRKPSANTLRIAVAVYKGQGMHTMKEGGEAYSVLARLVRIDEVASI